MMNRDTLALAQKSHGRVAFSNNGTRTNVPTCRARDSVSAHPPVTPGYINYKCQDSKA